MSNMANLSGQQIGPYLLGRLLGAGGMGAVYESYQGTVKRKVAVKILLLHIAQDAQVIARFNREVELAASMEHPHILPIYDHGTTDGMSYIVMRLLTGGTLDERLKSGNLHSAELLKIIGQVASALNFAHRHGVVHRDLKPGNILFDEDNNAYLADFGIARLVEGDTRLTQSGYILGTPAYMAPEQWRGENVDARTDIYALGVLVYQLLTGKMPFDAPTPYAMMHKHLMEPPPPITDQVPALPQTINKVMQQAMAKDPGDRFSSAEAFYGALTQAMEGKSPAEVAKATTKEARPNFQTHETATIMTQRIPTMQLKPARKFPLWAGMGIAALLLLIGIGAVIALMGGGDDESAEENLAATEDVTEIAQANPGNSASNATETEEALQLLPNQITEIPPTNVPTESPTEVPVVLPTDEPTQTPTSTDRPTNTPTHTVIPPTATFTDQPSNTPAPTNTSRPTNTATHTPTLTLTVAPTITSSPTNTLPPTNTPFPAGLLPGTLITRNGDWQPIERTIEGVAMVLVPAGTYTMGASDAQTTATTALCTQVFDSGTCSGLLSDERQQLVITIEQPFWIDKTEVTRATFSNSGTDTIPQTNIDWLMGQQHCTARGGRLPTEVEWEYAARGVDNLLFPWGNTWDLQPRVNYCDDSCASSWGDSAYNDGFAAAAPAGSFSAGASWVGALDMAGNVWEWTSTIYRNYPYDANDGRESLSNNSTRRTLRGGSWNWILAETSTTARATHIDAGPYTDFYGFRCVRDFNLTDLTTFNE